MEEISKAKGFQTANWSWDTIRTSKIPFLSNTPKNTWWNHLAGLLDGAINFSKPPTSNYFFLTLCGKIHLIPAIEINIFKRASAIGQWRNKWFTNSRLLRHMKHLFTSWSFLLFRLSRIRIAFLRVVQVKHLILEGSLIFQISFHGHWSIMSFEEYNLWYSSFIVFVYIIFSELSHFKLSGKLRLLAEFWKNQRAH